VARHGGGSGTGGHGRERRRGRSARWPGLFAAVAALSLTIAACGSSSSNSSSSGGGSAQKKIGISFPNATQEAAVTHELTYARAKASQLGYSIVLDDPGQDLNQQLNTINSWILQKYAAMITVTLDPGAFGNVVKHATSSGVKWLTYGSALAGQSGEINLEQLKGGNTIGTLAGDWLKRHVPGTAQVALLTYEAGSWARDREKGLMQGLMAADPNVKVVAKQDALSQTQGLQATSTILQAHPNLNAVLAIEETASEGAYQAFIDKHYPANDPKVFIGGIDGTLRALQLLNKGNTMYRGSAALSLKALGQGMVTGAVDASKNGTGGYSVTYTPLTPGVPTVCQFLKEWSQSCT
jgi:ribose transport system substrate-binding protein